MKLIVKISKSAEQVSSIDDLLLQILLRLPIRSFIRFKSVSKHWLSLITNPRFSLLRNPNPNPAIGIFLPCRGFHINPEYDYIHFDTQRQTNPPFKKLRFTEENSSICILQSCNGLLLCSNTLISRRTKRNYYVYNPTTKHFSTLPKRTETSNVVVVHGMSLAFDPAKSPHYKVVCIRDSESARNHYQLEVYSSDTGPWRVVGDPFLSDVCFKNGVYWNGAIHWISPHFSNLTILCFNIDLEMRGTMPIPLSHERGYVGYFGESCGHLHLIAIYEPETKFDVYEMKGDCSEWFVKYRVDVGQVSVAFPGMIRENLRPTDWCYYAFTILSLVRGTREDDDSFLVLEIAGKAIRYNVVDGSVDMLCELEGAEEQNSIRYLDLGFEYVESLCCV